MNINWNTLFYPNDAPLILIVGFLIYVFSYHTINTFGNITHTDDFKKSKYKLRIAMYINYIYFSLLVIFWHLLFYDFIYSVILFAIYFTIFNFFTNEGLIDRFDMHHIFKMIISAIQRKKFIPASQMDEDEFGVVSSNTIYFLSLLFLIINIFCTYTIVREFSGFYSYLLFSNN
tara:strand:- start:142 stop:663 length:522 start_codon:yes stop_codon:yes gene_type:complete